MVAAGAVARIVEKLALRSRTVYARAAKTAGSRWARIAGSAASAGPKLAARLNRVWIGAAAAVCGLLGIRYGAPEEAAGALIGWLTGTPAGMTVIAVGVSLLIILLTRRR